MIIKKNLLKYSFGFVSNRLYKSYAFTCINRHFYAYCIQIRGLHQMSLYILENLSNYRELWMFRFVNFSFDKTCIFGPVEL